MSLYAKRGPHRIRGPGRRRASGGFEMSGTMSLVHDTDRSVRLRFRNRVALVFAVVFGAGAWAAYTFIPDTARWIFGGAFGFFALLIGMGALWCEELEMDFATGRWLQRRGFFGNVRERRGTLDEIPEVELVLDRRASSDDASSTWQVRVKAPGWPRAVTVATTTKEEKGYAELERWAKRLRRNAVDRTGDEPRCTAWDALDEPLERRDSVGQDGGSRDFAHTALASAYANADSGFGSRVPEHPPAGSRIFVTAERGRHRIVLPTTGFNAGVALLFVFGLFFGGFGFVAALVGAGLVTGVRVNGEIPDGPVWGLAAIGSVFALVGLAIMVAPFVSARTHEWIERRSDGLAIGYSGLGFTWGVKTLPRRAIEGIDLSATTTSVGGRRRSLREPRRPGDDDPRELRIRTDEKVVRLGRELSSAELEWLRARVEAMARG